MEPIEIKYKGKIYKVDFSKLSPESIAKLLKLCMRDEMSLDVIYENLEIVTGTKKGEFDDLPVRIVMKMYAILNEEAEKMIKRSLYSIETNENN